MNHRTVLLAAAMLFALAPSVYAAEINFGALLSDLEGQPIVEGDKPLTLGRAAMMALTFSFPDDTSLSGEEKFKLGQLASRVYPDKTVDLSVEEVAMLKKRMGRAFNGLVVFRAWALLDPPGK